MGPVISLAGKREVPKSAQNRMKTEIVSIDTVVEWKLPPCQRPLMVNQKVKALAEELKTSEEIDGVITLGTIGNMPTIFLVDGQHRIEAFKLSGLSLAIVHIREIRFKDMAELDEEFVRLNTALVSMRPDDKLRGAESRLPALRAIRTSCEFVGYDNVRRGSGGGAILSMSTLIRSWSGSAGENPSATMAGKSVATLAENIDASNLQNLTGFLLTAHAAWGRDAEYYRLWGALNLGMCMWMWRRLVIDRDRIGNKRYAVLSIPEFKQCLMSVSANRNYLEWLVGRNMTERDRGPCYTRLKDIFVGRLSDISKDKKRVMLPAPAWSTSK